MAKKDDLVIVETGPTSGIKMTRKEAEAYLKDNPIARIRGEQAAPAEDAEAKAVDAPAENKAKAAPAEKKAK